ncbi:hypothetical protein BBF96_05350 [Anoxybacter fermentans]|uniref:Uncharacterized protein n=1 Tax=Anoxybacter fermentans TaxID=1323375 RepID=A0A3Q9HRF6_9FIRM|nr:hypothetical protein [Anoxybacter fermentans]AZR72865.1 hypothetical protein BBF96_05350 [Anoxybacter fermentans]
MIKISEFGLITEKEMKCFKSLEYDELMDWQFNLMQDLIDTSNDIIHKEYKDDIILQQGLIMIRLMILLNMVNNTIIVRFPDSRMADFIREQYTICKKPVSDLITEEINELKEHFDELKEILNVDFKNENRRMAGVNMVNRIATLNLREYEDALNRIFKEPEKV